MPRTSRRIAIAAGLVLFALVGVLVTDTGSAETRRKRPWRPRPIQPSFSVQVEDTRGNALRTFRHRGQTFVLGSQGRRYNIRVRNHSSRRVEAVVSVDGRDAITGRRGNFVSNRGYVIRPHGSVVIEGFRTSLSRVAAFRFSDPSESYSAQMGTPENVGVIGVALFPEKRRRRPVEIAQPRSQSKKRSRRARKPPSASQEHRGADSAAGRTGNLGTEFGESKTSRVTEVSFVRQNRRRPAKIVSIRYDDAEGLEARGIAVFRRHHRRHASGDPKPFPDSRFAPPPPRRRR